MSELRGQLDAELRTLDIAPAPVEAAMRQGRRIRRRRGFAVAAGVVAVIAIAAGVPVLTRAGAAPAPAVTRPDPVVTETPPGRGAPAGEIAQGTIGDQTWRVIYGKAGAPAGQYCFDVTVGRTGARGSDIDNSGIDCQPIHAVAGQAPPTEMEQSIDPGAEVTADVADADVVYGVLTFTDGQQLKLIPVTAGGQRWITFVAPLSMTIAGLTEHLGAAGHLTGQTTTAIPLSLPGQLPDFGLWQSPGQAAPPRATRVLASGTADGTPWSLTAYEGPWGTCFVTDPPGGTTGCEDSSRLAATELIGGWFGNVSGAHAVIYGSAAPGVASVAVRLSDGKTVTATPVAVGNERLFAFPVGGTISPTGWTAYSGSGQVLGTGSA
jgi:hypothetical protein